MVRLCSVAALGTICSSLAILQPDRSRHFGKIVDIIYDRQSDLLLDIKSITEGHDFDVEHVLLLADCSAKSNMKLNMGEYNGFLEWNE